MNTTEKIRAAGFGMGFISDRFSLNSQIVMIFFALMILDVALGTVHAWSKDKRDVTSKSFSKGLVKKLSRLALIIIVLLGFKGMGIDNVSIAMDIIMGGFVASEFYSLIRHIMFFNTGKEMPEADAFEIVLKKVIDMTAPKYDLTKKTLSPKKKK